MSPTRSSACWENPSSPIPKPTSGCPFSSIPTAPIKATTFIAAGRLKPGVTLAQANAQMKLAADQFRRRYPDGRIRKQGFAVEPLRDSIVSDVRSSLLVLVGAVSFVLLIACANVANLLLVRATGRKREFAIRAAMGAGRGRIIRQLLTESVLLSVIGGVLGLMLGFVGVRALLAVSPGDIPRIGENGAAVGIDWRVLAFTLGVSLFTGILFGLFPAISASRPDLNSTLKESSNRSGTGFRQSKARSLLVISEVSLALVLLIGAALLIRTFIALRGVNPGFDPHNVLTMEMSLTGDRFQKTAGVAQLVRDGRERLNAIPGVEDSASTCCLPLEGGFGLPFIVVGRPLDKDSNRRRRLDERITRVLRRIQDSHSARPRLHRPRCGRRARRGDHQRERWRRNSGRRKIPSASRSSSAKASGRSSRSPRGRSSASWATFTTAA